MNSNSPANDGQKASGPRPVCVPRPSQSRALTPVLEPSAAPPPLALASNVSFPPPAPRRPQKRAKGSPPPLPEQVLLTDADLIDDDFMRDSQPTSVDVELDCFSRTEAPPESHPRRKRALLACISGLLLVVVAGASFLARPLASQVFRVLESAGTDPARAPVLAVAALSLPASPALAQSGLSAAPRAVPSAAPRSKLSAHAKRGGTTVVSSKKPSKPERGQRLLPREAAR